MPERRRALVASATVMTSHPEGMRRLQTTDWQNAAWDFYDQVGELRFGVGWLANGMSRVNLVAARQPQNQGDEPTALVAPPDDATDDDVVEVPELSPAEQYALDLVAAIAGGSDGQGQLLAAASIQLSVPGVGYILVEEPDPLTNPQAQTARTAVDDDGTPHPVPKPDWEWKVLSQDELRIEGGRWEVATGANTWRPLSEDHVLVRFWRPHPRRSWEPDSPCRAVQATLRQITLLDRSIEATGMSRLAGAGMLIVPSEAEIVPLPNVQAATGGELPTPTPGDDAGEEADDFVDTLVQTMTIPIGDRASAAAVVPLVVRIPGEYCDKVQHLTFWSDYNEQLLPLRGDGVKRLALGLDMPPEVLTGMSGMNHWGAWQVEETAITLHIEPQSEIFCHALTLGYLRPAMRAAGYVQEAADFMVWYDTTDLTTRPDRTGPTLEAYDRVEVSGAALRREIGLSEEDKPTEEEFKLRQLLKVASGAPTLAPQMLAEAGIIDANVADAAADAAADDQPAGPADGSPAAPAAGDGPPDTRDDEPAGVAASIDSAGRQLAMLEACDGLVTRALERAGARLKSAAGRKVTGGPSAIDGPTDTLHTRLDATTYAQLDYLLDGAWDRTVFVGMRYGIDRDALTQTLDAYTRALLATGHAHDIDRLADALGLGAGVR